MLKLVAGLLVFLGGFAVMVLEIIGTRYLAKDFGGSIYVWISQIGVILIALAAFFVRKRHQRRRALKRNTWGAGLVPSLENKRQTFMYGGPSQSGRPLSASGGVPDATGPGMSQRSQPPTTQFGVPPHLGSAPNPNPILGVAQSSPYNPRLSSPISPFVAPSDGVAEPIVNRKE